MRIFVLLAVIFASTSAQWDYEDIVMLPTEFTFEVGGNDTIVLMCEDLGNRYIWQKNGVTIDDFSTAEWKISPKEETDAATYQCFVNTDYGVVTSQKLTVKPKTTTVNKIDNQTKYTDTISPLNGGSLMLPCQIPNATPPAQIEWSIQTIEDLFSYEPIADERIVTLPNGTLLFTNVTSQDVGLHMRYICRVQPPHKRRVLSEIVLDKLVFPKLEIKELFVSDDVRAMAGEKVVLYCVFGGVSQLEVKWSKDNVTIENNPEDTRVRRNELDLGKTLTIASIRPQDSGRYSCEVTYGGDTVVREMNITVEAPPLFVVRPNDEPHIAAPGSNSTFTCEVIGEPPPQMYWTYNSIPIPGTVKFACTQSTLTVVNVNAKDGGYYGCRVVNKHGEKYSEGLLDVRSN